MSQSATQAHAADAHAQDIGAQQEEDLTVTARRIAVGSPIAFAVLAIACPAGAAPSLQNGGWQAIVQLPDWTRVRSIANFVNFSQTKGALPLKPQYAKELAAARAVNRAGGNLVSPTYHCVPNGMPMMMASPGGVYEFLVTPGQVTIIAERENATRWIYTDGRGHPQNAKRCYYGHSIGHWEDGTLIVDTVATSPQLQLFYGFVGAGDTHVVERIGSKTVEVIHIDTVVFDSAFTAPFSYVRDYERKPDWRIMSDYCTQNNRDLNPVPGLQAFDLRPPGERGEKH